MSGNSGSNARLAIFPTRMYAAAIIPRERGRSLDTHKFDRALTNMKLKLKGAQTGHSLLKRKSEALTKRFREILHKIDEVWCILVCVLHRRMGRPTDHAEILPHARSRSLHACPFHMRQ